MPTYQYACTECGHQLEAVQSFTDAALVDCPECSGRLRKLYSAVGIVFKGSGFYRTDSRNGTNGAGTAKSAGAKETSSQTKSSETKSTDTASAKPADSGTSSSSSKTPAGAA